MKVKQYRPKDRLFSEQSVIDENGFITIPSTTLFNAGLSSDKKFVVLEKYNADNVYYIVPANFEYDEKEYGFLFNPEVENGDLKFNVSGLFNLKPDDSLTLDVFEFQLTLYDRHVVRDNGEDEETGLDTSEEEEFWDEMRKKYSPKGMKNPFEKDPYAEQRKDYNDLIDNPPSIEELDQMFGNILRDIVAKSTKKLHASKDPLLNEFIDDMLARVYGKDGQKVIMISNTELQKFIDDMTWWYKRLRGI